MIVYPVTVSHPASNHGYLPGITRDVEVLFDTWSYVAFRGCSGLPHGDYAYGYDRDTHPVPRSDIAIPLTLPGRPWVLMVYRPDLPRDQIGSRYYLTPDLRTR